MKKLTKKNIGNIVFFILIALLIIPQTRKPIHVFFSKGLAMFGPSVIDKENRETISSYNWNLVNENGLNIDFNEAKNKVVIINFWATWCPPCIAEMESLEELYQEFKENEQVLFLFVTHDSFQKTTAFKKNNNYHFPIFNPISETPSSLESSSIPTTFILDKKGKIAVKKTGAANWSSESIIDLINGLIDI